MKRRWGLRPHFGAINVVGRIAKIVEHVYSDPVSDPQNNVQSFLAFQAVCSASFPLLRSSLGKNGGSMSESGKCV